MTEQEMREAIQTDPDFVASKRHNYSRKELEERYPVACPDNVIAAALMLADEAEVNRLYEEAVLVLRESMGVKL